MGFSELKHQERGKFEDKLKGKNMSGGRDKSNLMSIRVTVDHS